MSFFTSTHCLQTQSEVWFTFLPVVSHICRVSDLIELLVTLFFYLCIFFLSSLNFMLFWCCETFNGFEGPQLFKIILSCQCLLPAASAQNKTDFRRPSIHCTSPALKPHEGMASLATDLFFFFFSLPPGGAGPADQELEAGGCRCLTVHSRGSCDTSLLHTNKICMEEENTHTHTTLQKHYWEQTQNRNQLALFHC